MLEPRPLKSGPRCAGASSRASRRRQADARARPRPCARLDPADPEHGLACSRQQRVSASLGSATTSAMPMPQLKTRSISSGSHAARLGEPAENRRHRPGSASRAATMSVRQHARQVAGQAAARDMRRRLQQPGAGAAPAAASRRSAWASSAPRPSVRSGANGAGGVQPRPAALDDPAHQRKPVGMHARAGQAEHDIARLTRRAAAASRAPPRPPRSPPDRSRRRGTGRASPPSRRRPGRSRPAGSPPRSRRSPAAPAPRQAAGGEIVQEEQRLGALHDEVVDAHRDQVDADRRRACPSRSRSSAWCRRRRCVATSSGSVKPAAFRSNSAPKPPRPPIDAGPARGARKRLDRLDERVAGVDVHPGLRGRSEPARPVPRSDCSSRRLDALMPCHVGPTIREAGESR